MATCLVLTIIEADAKGAEDAVFEPVEQLFLAMSHTDHEMMRRAVVDDFVLLEHGEVWSIEDLIAAVKPSDYVRINHFDLISTDIKDDIAFINYWNKANFSNGQNSQDVIWLESVVVTKTDGYWRLSQMHSTRLEPGKTPENVQFKKQENQHTMKNSVIEVSTSDGVTIYGQKYFGGLDDQAPLVLLFHQASSNGRGEYGEIASWLNESGFRAIAWDQRSGRARFGFDNRTVASLSEDKKYAFCDVSPDLQTALDYVTKEKLADKAVVWGSSYSAALVFKLAADNPQKVSGVAAFSPASGGPMSACRASVWLDEVSAPVVVFRPESEMERDSSVTQRELMQAAGAAFHVIADGVHGSSMLVDSRTAADMTQARATMLHWLRDLK